ncbi:GGDEF domain-containing protein [Thiomicrorhabdus immobilis]|uniref:diguanylate cyclase n=1 Tax=Thiomicrorhabdus immobilis TaxID=2791037 RepID=A0ABN6CX43_9GAMM|nr:GGDEF domain-containing protein [Thiomicrorhabdus immobilis]BCN92460.1 GGDEF domain-containing protein [Thiomicrorhabdus immobilis]
MLIDIQDTPDKAKRIFNTITVAFDEQNINPTPLNYFVWYQYFKGDNPKFRQAMDAILNDPFGYNDRVGKRLYDEFLVEDDNAASEFDRAFRRLIGVMVKKMHAWSDKLETHTKELDACTSKLSDPNLNAEQVKAITNSVLHAASSMKESSKAFQEEMTQSSIEVKHLRQQLIDARAEAMQDELTELGNRKAFNNAMEELIFDAQENPAGLCLIISDIDHFKKFNDNYGHLVGDSVLRYYASIMKKTKRDNETICRFGGEEFAILLANSSLEEAHERAEEIRQAIESAHLKRKNEVEPISTITASFGIASYKGSKENSEDFIGRADQALYKAKNDGRNRIVLETDLSENTAT